MYVYTEAIVFSLAIVLTSGSEIHAGKGNMYLKIPVF